jgi:hypothetical protein
MDAIIDVRCVDTNEKSYYSRTPAKALKSAETPFVISVGYEANAVHLSEKWQKPYSVTCGFVKSRVSLACVGATHQNLRGYRTPFCSISFEIQWEDGAGTAVYHIDQ